VVAAPGLIELSLEYGLASSSRYFDTDGDLSPPGAVEPNRIHGVVLQGRYGVFRGFEVLGSVPYVAQRELPEESATAGLGRVQLGVRYQIPDFQAPSAGDTPALEVYQRKLFIAPGLVLHLPTTEPALRPDPQNPDGPPLNDRLSARLLVETRYLIASQFQIRGGAHYIHTFANQNDVDRQRAPAPGWGAHAQAVWQPLNRAWLGLEASFDRAGRSEVGGEPVPDSDAWALVGTPSFGIHVTSSIDVRGQVDVTFTGKNTARTLRGSAGVDVRF
jgi:hypothetical protein